MTDSIRKTILHAFRDHLKAVRKDAPDEDPYSYSFENVKVGKLTDVDMRKNLSIGVQPGTERKNQRQTGSFSHDDPRLEVYVEFRVRLETAEKAEDIAEDVLSDIQRRMGEDETLGGLAIAVDELSNEINLDSYEDKTVEGVILYVVHYRHSRYDPRRVI